METSTYLQALHGHLSSGRGIAVYGCHGGQVATFAGELRRAGVVVQSVRLSELPAADAVPPPDPVAAACLVYQDLPVEGLEPGIESLVHQLVYAARRGDLPLLFFSRPPRSDYLDRARSSDLHVDLAKIRSALLLEQLVDLVESGAGDGGGSPVGAPSPGATGAVPPLPVDPALDADQRRAAQHVAGPIRVLAPAGSGKTKTLTNRIANLINIGVRPDGILALAFNRQAAEEMQQRLAAIGVPIARRLGDDGAAIRTFHSLGYEIVRDQLGWRVAQDSDGRNSGRALQEAMARVYPSTVTRTGETSGRDPASSASASRVALATRVPLGRLAAAMTRTRMELLPLAAVTVVREGRQVPFGPVFETYRQLQARRQFLDFDDMVYLSLRALLDSRALRCRVQKQFEHILVDEFQDLNRAQMLFLQVLALPQTNLFAVGDDDQLIYGWRGAEVRHILDFAATFPASADCLLSTNYRSSRRIVRHARWLIDHNRTRVAKDIQPRAGASQGELDLFIGDTLDTQAAAASCWIAERQGSGGMAWSDFAVLYRNRAHRAAVAAALDGAGIPHSPVVSTGDDGGVEDRDGDVAAGEGADVVVLSTVHSTKGNEFAYVVYFNVSARGFGGTDEAEEERRVAYVAVTRAIDGILITAPTDKCSPFVRELALNPDYRGASLAAVAPRLGWHRLRRWWLRRRAANGPPSAAVMAADHTAADLATELRMRRILRGVEH